MNLFGAGVISRAVAGGIIGAVLPNADGAVVTLGRSVSGVFAGGVAGWLYAGVVTF